MRNSDKWAVLAAVLSLIVLSPVVAQQESGEARLRAALRSTTAQLRDMQDQNAALTAKAAEAERDRMALQQKIADGEKTIAALRQQLRVSGQAQAQLDAQKDSIVRLDADYKENIGKWQAAYNEAAATARTRDADAKRFEASLASLRDRVRACETKNAELFRLSKEVLDLKDGQGFFSRLGALEPVTKLKRVELENMMQNYEDKMRTNEVARPAP